MNISEIVNNPWVEFLALLLMIAILVVPPIIIFKPHMTIEEIVEERERKEARKQALHG